MYQLIIQAVLYSIIQIIRIIHNTPRFPAVFIYPAAAGDAATGFDFGDAAHMAAELAPMLGGAPAGQRGR